ncbi:Fe(3+)-hydroxamate ABC transporter permease FhuB [Halomonas heilongjiangensis]|uniref:Fe(3+)-hydroxamate ABC transporter permease FhuB n=1 Tax=Halomonas heilongjiangensis TaxID=1387883 RepID=A0A2N7THD0_9GAMM|nr:Fe(3+)-hydroxamate ABC transporter permease FhuB [Halomonas heilongjiangensis]PMR67587.1 Fe(3+)-hydroxamate ABC transporter permease FhuB [Halomonas heilongjiangensis]PXX86780.1 Fe(3+)-hydroxamate ABC transporter permease FhuB [Halomonas heilongjiangensis]
MASRPFPLPAPGRLCLLLALPLLGLILATLQAHEGPLQGLQALFDSSGRSRDALLLHYSWWPRLVIALLAGSGLALAGVLMQQVLRNPLAAPTTLGVASGANLALMVATLMAPGLLLHGREWVALLGGGLTMGLVFLLAWRRGLAPMVVVLAGLVVNLYVGALAMALLLFHQEALKGLLIWGAGSLSQTGWDGVVFLGPRLAIGALLAWLLLRPLAVLELDDASARSLGVSLKHLRLAGLGLAVFITGCVVSVVGVIGFIGLAAPNIVRLAGARRLGQRLLWSPLLGALLLATTDLLLQRFSGALPTLIPTGATTAALGAPLLLWLIPRLKLTGDQPPGMAHALGQRHPAPGRLATGLALLLSLTAAAALLVGQTAAGWQWLSTNDWGVLEWRLPRLLAAAGSGVMLAIAGTIVQRLAANPMASPEVLGISGGSAIALIGAIFLLPSPGNLTLVAAGTLGALITLALLVILNRRGGVLPERLLLTGVAITALFDAVRGIVLSGGDPRGQQVIAWLSGSTYYVDLNSAVIVAGLAVALAVAAHPFSRWLDILPLGAATARALGMRLDRARLALLLLVALLTACATLVVGPLSFVGLLAPHLARLLGFSRARMHLLGAALVGALLMVLADWLGRQWLFPQEIPAGLVASLLGGAYFMWGLRRL